MKDQQASWNARLSRRQLLQTLGIGATGLALAACVPVAGTNAGETSAPAQETTVIRIDHRGYAEGTAGEVLNSLIAQWEESHPNFKIENTPVDYQGMDSQQWTERRLVAQDGPDLLFGNWTYLIEKWMEADLVNFYDDYLDMPNPYVAGNNAWRDQFIMQSERQSNGKIAWLGLDNTTLWFFYNKQIFEEQGLQPPTQWPEMLEMFAQLKDAGIIPMADYHSLAYAVWTFDPAANQILHDLFAEMADGVAANPLPKQVAQFVKDGRYAITSPEYQDSFRIATELWQYAPEGAFSGGDDQGYQLFLSGQAATRFTGCWENASLLADMATAENPFEWGSFSIPIIPQSMSQYATEKPTQAVFIAGYLLFQIPAYNTGDKLAATIDWLMFLSKPENLGMLMNEDGSLVPNIKDVPLPKGMEEFAVLPDSTFWYVNSWGNTHINLQVRDAFVRNWQNVLLGEMTIDDYNATMQPLLEQAADQELAA
jgi:ABC-type glycerol-3-phosphate transport system substrate-binding protein